MSFDVGSGEEEEEVDSMHSHERGNTLENKDVSNEDEDDDDDDREDNALEAATVCFGGQYVSDGPSDESRLDLDAVLIMDDILVNRCFSEAALTTIENISWHSFSTSKKEQTSIST